MAPHPRAEERRSDFAKRMRAARKHSGLSQKDAAEQIGIKQPTLSELESSATKSAHTAKAAAVYRVNAAWLQDGEGVMLDTPHPFSKRAAFVAARLDEIRDPATFDQACVMCEAIAALGKAGQLSTVLHQLALAGPAQSPKRAPALGHTKRTGADQT